MTSKLLPDDRALLTQVSQGDEFAFTKLFYAYHKKLAGYIQQITKSITLTEEIVQDVFTKIWLRREMLAEVNDFDAYLFITCRNMAFNALEKEVRRSQLTNSITPQQEEQYHTTDAGPGLELYQPLIEEAVRLLSPQQRKVYQMSRQEGMKHEEIATALHLSRDTVKRHISIALSFIKDYVKTHADKVLSIFLPFF